jgi:hypothetical protein
MSEQKTFHVSAGTQVVVTTEALGTNAMPVHPRGAVGIIARTPAGTEAHYLIRFPDGFETSFTREQFDILKHFKDRLPARSGADSDFELEQCVVYRCVVGSRAYGLETDTSDTDIRGVPLRLWRMKKGVRHGKFPLTAAVGPARRGRLRRKRSMANPQRTGNHQARKLSRW